ncbi:MAG: hypothetical protein WCK32_00785 [Chlorobiaceae bacterium]
MALTLASNWGDLPGRFMSSLKSDAAIVPVNQDTLAFTAGGYDPYNSGAVFAATSAYKLGSSTGEKSYKPVFKIVTAKDELDSILKKKTLLLDGTVDLIFNQDPEAFLLNNLTQRFFLIYRESVRDDGMVKYRVFPKVIFSPGDVKIPAGGDYATYPVTAQVEENSVAFTVTYRTICDIYAQSYFTSVNASQKLYWQPEFGSSVKLADLAVSTGVPTYVAAADNAAVTVAISKRTGFVTGNFVIQAV